MHYRRYNLSPSAAEIFFVDQTNVFFNFKSADEKAYVCSLIQSFHPKNLIYYETNSPAEVLKQSGLTQKWQARQISNFDYLMQLNTIAGRTYNDLTQYPVFPWVLADYESESIDLRDPKVYRDLSKPIGALNPQRLEGYRQRYNSLPDDDGTPKFLYGTHYSSAETVLFYLIRLEPFTTYFLQLQGGRFELADRMFDSIPRTWRNCLNATADVKELIPEFFYLPDFLVNSNNVDFGRKQNGRLLDNVVLPRWAQTPMDFITTNREALESEYVSAHLDEWIDLVFGYKQRGEQALKADNLFYYLTYEGAVDLSAIADPVARRAMEDQIKYFGQTPSQVLTKKHPKRFAPSPLLRPVTEAPSQIKAWSIAISRSPVVFIGVPLLRLMSSFLFMGENEHIVTVSWDLKLGYHGWNTTVSKAMPRSADGAAPRHRQGASGVAQEHASAADRADSHGGADAKDAAGGTSGRDAANVEASVATLKELPHSASLPSIPEAAAAPTESSRKSAAAGVSGTPQAPPLLAPPPPPPTTATMTAAATTMAAGDSSSKPASLPTRAASAAPSPDTASPAPKEPAAAAAPPPFLFSFDPFYSRRKELCPAFSPGLEPNAQLFALSKDGKLLVFTGVWDNSVQVYSTVEMKVVDKVYRHHDVVNCVAMGANGTTFATGSRDSTVIVWDIVRDDDDAPLALDGDDASVGTCPTAPGAAALLQDEGEEPKQRHILVARHVLFGHDDEVTCVDLNTELDIAVSGAKDGSCIIHTIRRGRYVTTFKPGVGSVGLVRISAQSGYIVVFMRDELKLGVFGMSGELLGSCDVAGCTALEVTSDGRFVIVGADDGTLVVRRLPTLRFVYRYTLGSKVYSLRLTQDDRYLLAGTGGGSVVVLASPAGRSTPTTTTTATTTTQSAHSLSSPGTQVRSARKTSIAPPVLSRNSLYIPSTQSDLRKQQ